MPLCREGNVAAVKVRRAAGAGENDRSGVLGRRASCVHRKSGRVNAGDDRDAAAGFGGVDPSRGRSAHAPGTASSGAARERDDALRRVAIE